MTRRLGILGGGQLGRMLLLAAARLGIEVSIFTDRADDPALQFCSDCHIGDYHDLEAVRRFARHCDVVTFEFENVPSATAEAALAFAPVRPHPSVLAIAQDRVAEKSFANSLGIATAPFEPADQPDTETLAEKLGLPFLIKTRRMGYDGKGQFWIRSLEEQLPEAVRGAPGGTLIAEGAIDFVAECSVIGARGLDGQVVTFPVFENEHEGGILRRSVFPPVTISPETQEKARENLVTLVQALDYVGVLTGEFFVLKNGTVLLNEIAPRVHNSGHGTEIGTLPDQFEMHVRAVCGLALPKPELLFATEMVNLIGAEGMARAGDALDKPATRVHIYGKGQARPGRKMGHLSRPA